MKPKPEPYPRETIQEAWGGELRTMLGTESFYAMLVLIVIGFISVGLCLYMATRQPKACDNPQSFACIDQRVQECLVTEQYTKDQCVTLVGGK